MSAYLIGKKICFLSLAYLEMIFWPNSKIWISYQMLIERPYLYSDCKMVRQISRVFPFEIARMKSHNTTASKNRSRTSGCERQNVGWNFWEREAFILIKLLFSDNIQILDKMFLVFEIGERWLTFDEFLLLLRSPSALLLVVFGLILRGFLVITGSVFALVAQGGSSRQPTCSTYSRSSAWSQILPWTSSRIWLLPCRFLGSRASFFSVVSQSCLWLHVVIVLYLLEF